MIISLLFLTCIYEDIISIYFAKIKLQIKITKIIFKYKIVILFR